MNQQREKVVLVHGIWMTGVDMFWLGRRLRRLGFDVYRCHYPSLGNTPAENARVIQGFLQRQRFPQCHLVAHSLGGIVLHHLFEQFPEQPPGRVVLLGSPVLGSGVARRLGRNRLTRLLLGRSGESGLLGGAPEWRGERELGVIAGVGGVGVGRFIGGLVGENDGTVALSETRVENARARLQLRASHMGLLFSRQVAEQTAHFLRNGCFF